MTLTTTRPATQEPVGYQEFYDNLRNRLRDSRHRAAQAMNLELLMVYWRTGADLIEREGRTGWGTKAARRISQDVHRDFTAKGWAVEDIVRMRQFAESWPDPGAIADGDVGKLPWQHVGVLLDLLDCREARERFAEKAVRNGWSVTTLVHAIEQEPRGRLTECLLMRREGKNLEDDEGNLE
ncbi:DUF1016 N-terminal domain-containing protein [Myceligenerans crystallogenes]|uniref:YhcG N-terminal domain-containing protein n=1 Tax=Myceligenerans crystallogenes TaxID=316335 RepID=A0ABN2NCW6_9MICO